MLEACCVSGFIVGDNKGSNSLDNSLMVIMEASLSTAFSELDSLCFDDSHFVCGLALRCLPFSEFGSSECKLIPHQQRW